VKWYQSKLAALLKMGVGAIKVDFGEGAPVNGQYASGRSGWYEHNLYPLRYNKAVGDITRETTGENIIWARSAWAGSQRYPLHWGGDAENTDSAMAAELRGGLSFGLSGFTYWSHDVGGFVNKAPRDLYRRWLAWGVPDLAHARARRAAARALGVRRGFDGRLPPRARAEVFADAVHPRAVEGLFGARLPRAARALLRVPERPHVVDD
jgi:alpha-D-xyloside xylohydrolase